MTRTLTLGAWRATRIPPAFSSSEILEYIPEVRQASHIIWNPADRRFGLALEGEIEPGAPAGQNGHIAYGLLATLPPLYPEWLGDRAFLEIHNVRFPYVAGAMARGLTTSRIVIEMGRAGMFGFFGAAGLSLPEIERGLDEIEGALGPDATWGSNLIHSPNEPVLEEAVVDLYISRGVRRVSASAFMSLTPSVVRYACHGLTQDTNGHIHRRNYVFAKISRPEVAEHFMAPPPAEMLSALVAAGKITPREAELAALLPVAEDITVEADSGGHTDNRPLTALLPIILMLRDRLGAKYNYGRRIRIGAAGGLGSPRALAAAFSAGADYVLTGSVNQSAIESGLAPEGKQLLAQAGMADVIMAPSADMFEMGVKVQVLKRGVMFGVRAQQLYDLYGRYNSLSEIPGNIRARLEKDVFQTSLDAVWSDTRAFFQKTDPEEVERAENDPKHLMALVFRWYLGKSSRWAITGEPARKLDFQIWCGPAMGAFNDWVRGSFLEDPANRTVVQIALNLLEGAAVVMRAGQLRSYGLPVPAGAFHFTPRPLS